MAVGYSVHIACQELVLTQDLNKLGLAESLRINTGENSYFSVTSKRNLGQTDKIHTENVS